MTFSRASTLTARPSRKNYLQYLLRFSPYAAIFSVPFLAVVSFPLVYPVLILISVATLTLSGRFGIPVLFILKFCLILFLAIDHSGESASLANLVAIVIGDVFLIACFNLSAQLDRRIAVQRLFLTLWAVAGVGFLFSTALSGPLQLANPLGDLLSGERLRILNGEVSGHSISMDVGAIALVLVFSPMLRKTWLAKILFAIMAIGLLLAARNVTALTMCGAVMFAIAVERLMPSRSWFWNKIKLTVHLSAVTLLIVMASGTEVSNTALRIVRTNLLMQDESLYRGDYTSGRALLNEILIDRAADAPLLGNGQDDSTLRYGVLIWINQEKGALSESTFRLAVKYGYPFMLLTCLIFAIPLIAFFSRDRELRSIFVPIAYISVIIGANGSAYEVPHTPAYIIYGFLAMLCLAWTRQSSPQQRLRRQRRRYGRLETPSGFAAAREMQL